MPLDRLMLMIVIVIAAAGATIWLGWLVLVTFGVSPGLGLALGLPTMLVAYVAWRLISERVGNADEDHYDGIDR